MYPLVCPLCRIALPTVDDVCPRDGRVGVEAPWLPVPPTLSQRFRVLEPFAHGDMGSLYLADEPETGRRGLLKVLAPLFREQHGDRQRLRRELVKQATLQRGALVVPLASGESDGATWIFREWLDGVSLEVRLSREGALPQTEALAIAAQIASALDELHRGGLLHRDVKPGHVFLQPTSHGIPRAFLIDAGVAVALQMANGGRLHGTPGYLAPEQLTGGLVSFRSDLYSLGCVLYRMLTGRPAFSGESREETLLAQRRGELPPTPAALPNGIGSLLQSILSRDPQERPFSAQKLRRTLEPFLPDGALMEKQPPTSTFETVPQPRPSTAPQPSGTLRPPPPPSTRPASAQGTTGGTLPPGALRNKPPSSREPTHQLDVEQLIELEELLPPPKKATSVPPPMPEQARSSSKPPLPSKKPAPPSEKTQPIRLDQILAVAAARKANAPPVAPEPPHVPEPQHVATIDSHAPESSLFASAELDDEAPVTLEDDADDADDHDATTQLPLSDARAQAEAPRPAQAAVATAKATLMGVGGDPMEPPAALAPLAPPAPEEAQRSERDHPTERVPVGSADLDDSAAIQAVTGGLPASLLSTFGGGRTDSRRLLMYASAALVGLGVLGVGASALIAGNGDPARERAVVAPPPLPAAVAAQRAEEVTGPSEATTRPTVEPVPTATPVAPMAVQQLAETAAEQEKLARAASAEAEKQDKLAQAQARAEERRLAKEAREEERRLAKEARHEERRAAREARASKEASSRDLLAAEEATRKRERASRSSAADTAAKSAGADSGDKAASFAEAREQARTHYAAKRYKEAAAAYERAAKLDPSHAGTFAGLGAARLQIGDNKGALQAYQRAVQLSPETSGFHAALGRAYVANGDKSRAIASYKKALALDAKNEAAKSALRQLQG